MLVPASLWGPNLTRIEFVF